MPKAKKPRDAKELRSIEDLIPDSRNANEGTQRGLGMLENSLSDYGAGRSVLADRNGRLIAGNKTVEAAASRGITEIIVIPTDGTKLIVHQRTDLDLEEDVEATELAIADNRSGQVSLQWNPEVISELISENRIRSDKFWNADELSGLLNRPKPIVPEIGPQAEPQLANEKIIEIRCSTAFFDSVQDTLLEWSSKEGVIVNVS